MNLDKNKHRRIMLDVLDEISGDSLLANNMGFKGGTACYFVYGLDRFSVDLDFDLLNKEKEDMVKKRLLKILTKYGRIKTKKSIKVVYAEEQQALKIDLSSRYENNKLNTYEIKDIVSGLPLKVLRKEDIFAHKLIALIDRSSSGANKNRFIANRDIYDIYFFLKHNWGLNKKIIKEQTGKNTQDYLQDVLSFIKKYSNKINILERLGELVDDDKRHWVQNNLKNEVIKKLAIRIESMKE